MLFRGHNLLQACPDDPNASRPFETSHNPTRFASIVLPLLFSVACDFTLHLPSLHITELAVPFIRIPRHHFGRRFRLLTLVVDLFFLSILKGSSLQICTHLEKQVWIIRWNQSTNGNDTWFHSSPTLVHFQTLFSRCWALVTCLHPDLSQDELIHQRKYSL